MSSVRSLVIVVALVAVACGTDSGQATSAGNGADTTPAGEGTCPVTVPIADFVPPAPYPEEAPPLYESEWYGTERLWTMLATQGEVWHDLPRHEGALVQKTFWWSEDYPAGGEPGVTVTGRRLDGEGSFEFGPATNGFRHDIGDFMLVGIGIPEAGCWELTGHYGTTSLSYVVLVEA